MDDPPFADQVQRDFVAPFYSSVNMRLPINDQAALALSQAAHTVALDQILWMLGTHWRPRRVGAWFALARREKELDEPLLESLRTSRGYLTAPDLGFAAVRRMKQGALSALRHYESIAAKKNYGGLSEISALIELAGGTSEWAQSDESSRVAIENRSAWADLIESL